MKYYQLAYIAAAALTFAACSQDDTLSDISTGNGRLITFEAQTAATATVTRATQHSMPDVLPLTGEGCQLWLLPTVSDTEMPATRGTQLNSVSDLSAFGVSAYKHATVPGNKTLNEYLADNDLKPDFFYNLRADKITGTEKFKVEEDFYWPATDEVLSFFAYAPYGDNNVTITSKETGGPQKINFRVNTNVSQQADLITAQASSTAHTNAHEIPAVRLNFTHQLTGIRFIVGSQFLKGFVKSISLKGVYTEGTYTIGGGWDLDSKKKGNFAIAYTDKEVQGTPGEEVTAASETFLMIPHEFSATDTAYIEVVYNDTYTDYVVKSPLAGTVWEAGKTVTYAITSKKLTMLQIASIDFPTTPTAASGMPDKAKSWQENDTVGMYVVAADSTTIKHQNIPVVYKNGKWNIKHDPDTIYRLPGEQYYFYYPYSKVSNDQPLGYPEQNPTHKSDADVFFEGVISHHTTATDQSNLDDFMASDLMVAKATDEGHASTIKATMERQVGIAVISIASKTIPENIVYRNGVETSNTGNYTIATTDKFASNTPYQNGNKFYYFTKVGGTTSFSSKAGEKYYWNAALTFNLENNTAEEKTAQTDVEWNWIVKEKIIWEFTKATANNAASIYTWGIPYNAKYKFECWGGGGGKGFISQWYNGGCGAYATGKISLLTTTNSGNLYVYVGGRGSDGTSDPANNKGKTFAGGYNGGGTGCVAADGDDCSGAGGGATDIRTNYNASWNNSSSLGSRIMIAAGGGGGHGVSSTNQNYSEAIDGGTPNATGQMSTWSGVWTANVNQSQGNALGQGFNGTNGGGNNLHAPAGGGGGLWGGTSALTGTNNHGGKAAGGSSFISGATSFGCSTISGYTFTEANFIKGSSSSCPSMTIGGSSAALGQVNGYARITYDQQDQ